MNADLNPSIKTDHALPVLPPVIEAKYKQLENLFLQVREATPDLLAVEIKKEIAALATKFQAKRFHLVFLGQYKRGKTSLLNSFLGLDLLPTGVLPVTSIVTVVRHGPRFMARVSFMSGETIEISHSDLPHFATERGNPQNAKGVHEVEVFVPFVGLESNVSLVDTPGIGSIFEHNTRVAYDYVPKADAIVFVFSPEPPLSQAELDFLRHLQGRAAKIFFVLNKADQLIPSAREEILEFSRRAILDRFPACDLQLFTVSAKQALSAMQDSGEPGHDVSGLSLLKKSVREFLAASSESILLRSTLQNLRRLVSNEILALELEERAASVPVEELASRIRSIRALWENLAVRHRETFPILRAEMAQLEESLWEELKIFVAGAKEGLEKFMRSQLRERTHSGKNELVVQMDSILRGQIAAILDEWRGREESAIQQAFESLTARFGADAARTVEQIQTAAAGEFGLVWNSLPLSDYPESKSGFSIELDSLLNWGMGQWPLLLPRFLFIRYLSSRLEDASHRELFRNAGRLREDLGNRMDRSASEFLQSLSRYVEQARDSVLGSLGRAAALKDVAVETRHKARATLTARIQFIRDLDAQLALISEY